MVGFVILATLAVLSILSVFYGTDSRDGSFGTRGPVYPVGLR